jgi:hypothetical protein
MLKLFSPSLLDWQQAYIDLMRPADGQRVGRWYATLAVSELQIKDREHSPLAEIAGNEKE